MLFVWRMWAELRTFATISKTKQELMAQMSLSNAESPCTHVAADPDILREKDPLLPSEPRAIDELDRLAIDRVRDHFAPLNLSLALRYVAREFKTWCSGAAWCS
jgi:hypothetical protein